MEVLISPLKKGVRRILEKRRLICFIELTLFQLSLQSIGPVHDMIAEVAVKQKRAEVLPRPKADS